MDLDSPKSEPEKSFEKPNTEKARKDEIASKPDDKPKNNKNDYKDKKIEGSSQKPKDKPKNKIEPRKIDPKKEPKNKIEPRKIDIQKEPRHKIQRQKSNPLTPSRNKIKRPKFDPGREPINKIQPQRFTPEKSKNKIEPRKMDASQVTKNKIVLPKVESKDNKNFDANNPNRDHTHSNQNIKNDMFNLEKIKDEIKKLDWKSMSENWNITTHFNNKPRKVSLDPTKDISKENPLYKHKQWLKSVYNNKSLNLNDVKLEKICGVDQKTIWRWRNKYNIPTKLKDAKQKLHFDGKSKECGRCHEIKPYSNFTFRRKNDILYPKSTCKKCDDEQKQIFALKNRIKVMENLNNGKLGVKCPECNTGPEKLPALEFHHTNPSIKKTSWHERMYKNWERTKEILEKEKVKILCRNCHTKQRTNTYKNYENIIKNADFNLNASTEKIRAYVSNHYSNPIRNNDFYSVVHQIKKFTIVNKLYGGKCVGCEQITTQNNLPTLLFHHRDVNDDKWRLWSKIQSYELNQIKNELIEKNCVSLCSNCHQMIHSTNFKTQHEEIISSEHWGQVKTYFNTLEKNVRNFKFPKDIDRDLTIKPKINQKKEKNNVKGVKEESKIANSITHQKGEGQYINPEKDPINLNVDIDNNKNSIKILNIKELEKLQNSEYGYGEAWMKYLVHIAKLTQDKTIIRTKDIAESAGVITRNVRKNLVNLVNKELIIILSENNDRHVILSEKGFQELHKIKKIKCK